MLRLSRRHVYGAAALLSACLVAAAVPSTANTTGYDGSGLPSAIPFVGLLPDQSGPVAVPDGTVTWPSGVYSGVTAAQNDLFGTWRGRPLQAVTTFQGSSTADDMAEVTLLGAQYKARKVRLVLSSALWPQDTPGSLTAAAAGAYDAIFTHLATNLVAQGLPATTIRLGWEFNGDWQPWRVLNAQAAKDFAAAWRHVVTAMRAVPGGAFTFDWAPVAINGLQNPALAWPGKDYVDVVGMSLYNYTPHALATPPADRFRQLQTWRYGLNWQVALAKTMAKPVAYPEWGEVNRPLNAPVSSGDDPYFIAAMFQHFAKVHPAYECYFNVDTTDLTFYGINTYSGQNLRSAAMYKTLWSRR